MTNSSSLRNRCVYPHLRRVLTMVLPLLALGLARGELTVIRAGHLFDGESLLSSRVLLVEDGRIFDVIDPARVMFAKSVDIDAADCTVLPGFIDSHIHFAEASRPYLESIEKYGWGRWETEQMSAFPGHRRQLLAGGVTAIADMGSSPDVGQDLRQGLKKGRIVGPEIFFSGPAFTAPGGHPAGSEYVGEHDLIDLALFQVTDTAAARTKAAGLAARGADYIAIVYESTECRGRAAPRLSQEVAKAVISEAHRQGLRAFAQVGSVGEAQAMVSSGADGIECCFVPESPALLREMAAKGVFLTPIISPWAGASTGAGSALRRALELGVPLCVGSGFPGSGGDCGDGVLQEMRLWEENGVSRSQVLRAATSIPARKVAKEMELGRIAPGYRADLVFVRGSIDTGGLSPGRISRVVLAGQTVVENGRVPASESRYFRETSTSFLAYPYYDPLLSFLVGASAQDLDLFHSGVTASADVLASIRNMWQADLTLDIPSPIPRTSVRSRFWFDNQNRWFYGVGNASKSDDTLEYANLIFKEGLAGTTRITQDLALTTGLQFDQTRVDTYRLALAPGLGRGGDEAAVTMTIAHDTRDNQGNPWSGHYIALSGLAAGAILPGGHNFQKVGFDLRGYASPARHHIVAGRLLFQQAFGDVPYFYLPDLGSDTLGRGYLYNRFRDSVGLYGQLEYRFPVYKFLSGVAFVEVGQVQPNPFALRFSEFHPGIGIGPRFTLGPNETQIIGIDFGFVPEETSKGRTLGWNISLHNGQAF